MADLCCIAELRERFQKIYAEYNQSIKVAELEAKVKKQEEQNARLARDLEEVYKINDGALNINSLPNEIILEVFSYLTQNQLGQIARVCRKWNVLTKSPFLWKRVSVQIFSSCKFKILKSFINGLPSCVTSISLDFVEGDDMIEPLAFEELCLGLQEKCPNLEKLILTGSLLSNSLPAVINICTQFLQHLKNLVFIDCIFPDYSAGGEYFGISKIESLVLLYCFFDCFNKSSSRAFSKMPNLKQLHLYGTICMTTVHDSWFKDDAFFLNRLHVLNVGRIRINSRMFSAIQNHGHNLKELYLCSADLQDHDLNFTDSVFPYLKTVCIYNSRMTCEGVVSLIRSCPSLENVYVSEHVAEFFAAHPFVIANRSKSGIVKAIYGGHNHHVNYSHT